MQRMKILQILLELDMNSKAVVSKNIKALRLKEGLSQEALAKAAGVDAVTIRHYEYGKRFPRPEILDLLAKALRVEVYHLFMSEPPENEIEASLKKLSGLLGFELIKKS